MGLPEVIIHEEGGAPLSLSLPGLFKSLLFAAPVSHRNKQAFFVSTNKEEEC
jgi:hypothetical protein